MGGNLVLKMAGEIGCSAPPELCGFAAVAPAVDLAACADALSEPRNVIYETYLVRRLKRRMRFKAHLFPGRYPVDRLGQVTTVREFDEVITAPFCGFCDADDYYARSRATRVLSRIARPALVFAPQDDPVVPFESFENCAIRENASITFLAPRHGGHCAYISRERGEERFWAEARIVEFCKNLSRRCG